MLNTRNTQVDTQKYIQRPRFLSIQIGIAFLAFLLIGANDGAFGVILPGIAAHYSMNKANISLLFLFNSAGYLIAAFLPWILGNLAQLINLNVLPPFALVVVLIMWGFWLRLRTHVVVNQA